MRHASGAAALGALDRYALVAPLGRGGMAEVFLAAREVAPGVHRPVVLKRLHDHFGDDPVVLQMFIDEARLVCALEHESIVKTFEVGIMDGHFCIAMEYLAGQPLRRLTRRAWKSGGLPIDLAVYIAIRVLEALEHAHDAQDPQGRPLEIVHRDISPQNILVTNNGQVKVLDFGIAKAKSHEGRTDAGLIKGKFAYLAPEQASNQNVDRRADLWSVGVVLWEMLSGARLFKADNEVATLRATLEADIPVVSTLRAEIHPKLDRIVSRSLQRNPNLRYRNAADMRGELQGYLDFARQRPDKSVLANLMREQFHDEIVEQRRLVYELMETGGRVAPGNQESPSMTNAATSESDSAISMEMSRMSSLVQELTVRHRTVLHRLLAAVLVFVVVAASVVCIFLVRFNRQATLSMQRNSSVAPTFATNVAPPKFELTDYGEMTRGKVQSAATGAVVDAADNVRLPIKSAEVVLRAQASAVAASDMTASPKIGVPRLARKRAKQPIEEPRVKYGI
jgi:serine/threonine protein kinase